MQRELAKIAEERKATAAQAKALIEYNEGIANYYKEQKIANEALEKAAPNVPPINWFVIQTLESRLLLEGFSQYGPAIAYFKGATVFQSSTFILSEFVGSIAANVEIVHDTEWQQFPEIVQAMKLAGVGEYGFCVAKSTLFKKWGVGLGGGWKGREPAAKVALAVSIAKEGGRMMEMCHKYPEFYELCLANRLLEVDGGGPPAAPP